ncbi:MAG: TolC family protein [Bacteroidota bacterium]|nr:TolC family protein [Bacteroidota bacterium]
MKKLIIYLGLFAFCLSCYSQDSLMHYLEIAVKNSPTVLQRYNEYQASLQKVPQVGSLPDPQLEMGVFLSPMELISGNQVADIKLMQMFPWFGVLKNAKDEMSLMAKAKYETFRDARSQVYYDVQRTWFDLYKIRQNIRISEKNNELLKTIERLTLVKFRSGSSGGGSAVSSGNMTGINAATNTSVSSGMNSMGGNPGAYTASRPASSTGSSQSMNSSPGSTGLAEVYQIQIEMSSLEDNIASLRNEEQVIEARFNSLLNRSQTIPVAVVELLSIAPLDIAYLTVNDSVFTNNPMLGMLQYEQKSLAARTNMQKQMGLPMVGVGLNYTVINKSEMSTSSMNGRDMIMPMVTVTLPIYRKKYKAMQMETRFLKTASEQNYQATANALQTEYYEALQLYNDAQRRMKLYDSQSKLAKKSLDISIKTFSSSSSGLSDILRIRQLLLDYELKQVEAVVDFNKAEAWIKRLRATAP